MASILKTPRTPSAISQVVLLKDTPAPTLPVGEPVSTINDVVFPGPGGSTPRQLESLVGKVVVLLPVAESAKEIIIQVTDLCPPRGPLKGQELVLLDPNYKLLFATGTSPKREFALNDLISIRPCTEFTIVPQENGQAYLVQKRLHEERAARLKALQPERVEGRSHEIFPTKTAASIVTGALAIGVGALLLLRGRGPETESFEVHESNRLAAVKQILLSQKIGPSPGVKLGRGALSSTQHLANDLNALALPSLGISRSLPDIREQINNLSFKSPPNVTNEVSLTSTDRQKLVAQSDAWFSEAVSIYLSLRDDLAILRSLLEAKAGAVSFDSGSTNQLTGSKEGGREMAEAVIAKSVEPEQDPPVATRCSVRPSAAPAMATNWTDLTTTVLTRMAYQRSDMEELVVQKYQSRTSR